MPPREVYSVDFTGSNMTPVTTENWGPLVLGGSANGLASAGGLGFGTTGAIFTRYSGPLDPGSLPPPAASVDDPAASSIIMASLPPEVQQALQSQPAPTKEAAKPEPFGGKGDHDGDVVIEAEPEGHPDVYPERITGSCPTNAGW